MSWCTVPEALDEIRAGRMIVVADHADRENEGDLVMAAEHATPEAVNFMTRAGRGLVCVPMLPVRLAELELPQMVNANTAPYATAFTVSVDAVEGLTTGISAFERATTIRRLAAAGARPTDFARPGHVFPLAAAPGGVLDRPGHTEAAVDLARLAGLAPAGVLCEILADDGTMARGDTLADFAAAHGLKMLAIETLIAFRRDTGAVVERTASARLPTAHGSFTVTAFAAPGGETHLALVHGDPGGDGAPALVRVHSECLTGDVFGSRRCDCGAQLDAAMAAIAREGAGIVVYLRQEGRGIGLANKIRAYALQDTGLDTVEANHQLGFPADQRDYGAAAAILAALGVRRARLLTNNPAKIEGVADWGITVVERVPLLTAADAENARYLAAKRDRLGHLLGEVASNGRPGVAGPAAPANGRPAVAHAGGGR
ncbi:bifunctional 3,4-dihydroxy-2-butanone-4-phosphate synthase/GTP cyclohydrolase II [bacterium]|nr:MAG: bifunctional 3,4-dihydroxy-2-butanone-4-phosphate synthase/GTP cyclohydrolase II [bacterium]